MQLFCKRLGPGPPASGSPHARKVAESVAAATFRTKRSIGSPSPVRRSSVSWWPHCGRQVARELHAELPHGPEPADAAAPAGDAPELRHNCIPCCQRPPCACGRRSVRAWRRGGRGGDLVRHPRRAGRGARCAGRARKGRVHGRQHARRLGVGVPALPVHTPWSYVVLAEVLAVAVGIAAGMLPARRAAHLDPLEALRSE